MTLIIFIIVLTILVLVHEFGHFIVAKKSGVRVDEFGLGFPPKLISKKWGGTLYTINAIPFGGFVKIFGENSHAGIISEEDKKTSFIHKPKWIQALILVAGVSMNMIFAWFVLSLGFFIGLPSSVEHEGYGTVKNISVMVVNILPNSPAEKTSLQPGAKLISISEKSKTLSGSELTPETFSDFVSKSTGSVNITYSINNTEQTISIEPSTTIIEGRRAIGLALDEVGILQLPVHQALIQGARTTWILLENTIVGLGTFVLNIFTAKSDLSQVTGPIGIAGVVGEATHLGFTYLLSLVALISINLAVINLLPFPALDGGRLLFVGIEAITRKTISPKIVSWSNAIGFTILILLMVVVTGHDILKLL